MNICLLPSGMVLDARATGLSLTVRSGCRAFSPQAARDRLLGRV
jgi:hypothetical protein